ncbi:LOW QUALITY PROTEIN: SRPX2-like protein, partial [Mya arenaria]
VRCPKPTTITNGYFICHPSTEFVLEAWCRYGCYEGFDLVGETVRICQRNNMWSGTNAPSCKPWKCPLLPSIEGAGLPQCTKGTSFQSVCSYDCTLDGFDMPQHVAKALVCSKEKRWRKNGEPACIDVEPTVFKTCPSTRRDRESFENITSDMEEPSATDNSNTAVNVTLISGYAPGTRVLPGKYDIVYGVFDAAGNRGRNCQFTVIVRDIKCSRIYPTPFVRVQCPNGTRTGSICEISCEPGKTLQGTSVVTWDQSAKGLYGQWNWNDDGQSTCKQTSQCLKITPPRHGALACDNWLGGSFCQAQCQNGTEIPRVNLETLYVCSDDGNWMPTLPQFTPCKAARYSHILSMPVEVQNLYYGDCTDKSTQEQIAKNFIQQMMSSLYQPEACPDNSECGPENVQIFCGDSNRRKRAVRETSHQENISSLSINFNIQLKTITNISDIQNRHRNIIKDIGKCVNEHAVKIYGNSSRPVNVTVGPFKVHCYEGSVQSTQSINCVECPEGTYYQGQIYDNEPTCLLCQKGTYQDKSGESKCISCPYAFTTHSLGSAYAADCNAHGKWSTWGNWSECTRTCGDGIVTRKRLCNNPTPDNGGKTCVGEDIDAKDCNNTDCPVCPDFIAPVNGSAECVNSSETINCTIACNAGFDFDSEPMGMYYCGANTFSVWNFETNANPTRRLPKCKVPCGSGSYLNVDYCEPCPVGFYQDKDAQLSCKLCPSGKTTLGEGSDLVMDCSVAKEESNVNEAKEHLRENTWYCQTSPLQRNGLIAQLVSWK